MTYGTMYNTHIYINNVYMVYTTSRDMSHQLMECFGDLAV